VQVNGDEMKMNKRKPMIGAILILVILPFSFFGMKIGLSMQTYFHSRG